MLCINACEWSSTQGLSYERILATSIFFVPNTSTISYIFNITLYHLQFCLRNLFAIATQIKTSLRTDTIHFLRFYVKISVFNLLWNSTFRLRLWSSSYTYEQFLAFSFYQFNVERYLTIIFYSNKYFSFSHFELYRAAFTLFFYFIK